MGFVKVLQSGSSLQGYSYSVDLKGPIGIKWASIGAQATTGRALGNPTPLDDGIGMLQMFALGAIFWSPGFGAVYMSERVWRKWSSPSVEKTNTVTGQPIQSFLGNPTGDSLRHDTGSTVQEWMYFERGMIYVGSEGSHVVYGEIYRHYRVLNGIGSVLGVPITDERAAPGGGRVSHFASGDIYQHPRTGAHEVHGAIRDRYLDLGGPASVLGYPVSDEESITATWGEIGRFNRFENGSGIYYSGSTGAWEVYGAIWAEWQTKGGVGGKLGFPTSGETDTPSSGGRYNEFEHGVMVWHGSGPYAGSVEVTDLQLLISGFTVNENFNIQVRIFATPNDWNVGRMPADGEFNAGTMEFDTPPIMVGVDLVRANSAFIVWLEAISENTFGTDDKMGTINYTFNIDNVWGLLDTDFTHRDNLFEARFRVEPRTTENITDPHQLFWPFSNTSTFKLGWDIYARTFRDVVETDKHPDFNPLEFSVHPWEIFFYETFYNNQAEGGSCFGTCLEAVYAREKRTLFLEPLQTSPLNPYERNHLLRNAATVLNPGIAGDGFTLNEINVKHGYQVGAGMVEFFLKKWTAGALRDPERAYRESYADFQAGNWPLLTISDEDEFSMEHGHVILPYEWDPTPDKIGTMHPDQPLTIYVKNPNYPQAGRNDSGCRIEINHQTWDWTFKFDEKSTWKGSGDSGGRLLAIPFSELNARPVLPGSIIFELIAAGIYVVLGGEGDTEQITDGYGRTFFHRAPSISRKIETSIGQSVKEINWDSASRIPNLMQVPMFGRFKPKTQTTAREVTGQQTLEVTPEFYYHRPGPPPAGPASPIKQTTTVFVGSSRRSPGGVGETLGALREDALHYQIRGKSHGQMRWTVQAPMMSATVVADMEPGVVDSIHLGGTGGHFQNLTVQFPNATKARNVSVTVAGWRGEDRQQMRSFVLEGLSLDKSDSVRAQMTDGGRELIIENVGRAKTFDLRLVAGVKAETVTLRPNVSLDAASVVRLRPSDWSPATSALAPIRLDVLDKTWKKVLKSTNV